MRSAVFESERFEVTQDKAGKFWLWSKTEDQNFAMRSKTEIDCYREALDLMSYSLNMIKQDRDDCRKKLNTLEECFENVFDRQDDEY